MDYHKLPLAQSYLPFLILNVSAGKGRDGREVAAQHLMLSAIFFAGNPGCVHVRVRNYAFVCVHVFSHIKPSNTELIINDQGLFYMSR